jgi:hypothetical protein
MTEIINETGLGEQGLEPRIGCIYALLEPFAHGYTSLEQDSWRIRYVGKTVDLSRRFVEHLSSAENRTTHKEKWLYSLAGEHPEVVVLERADEDRLNDLEISWIKRLREEGCDLTNGTEGGDGVTMTPAMREKISRSLRRLTELRKQREQRGRVVAGKLSRRNKYWGLGQPLSRIPVQVDGRIVDCVDASRAHSMLSAPNVEGVFSRRKCLVMVLVKPMVLGKGDVDQPSSHMDSRRAHMREALFTTDDAPTGDIKGMPFVFAPKSIPRLGVAPKRREPVLPPTASRRKRKKK